jgi:hypothetical protein
MKDYCGVMDAIFKRRRILGLDRFGATHQHIHLAGKPRALLEGDRVIVQNNAGSARDFPRQSMQLSPKPACRIKDETCCQFDDSSSNVARLMSECRHDCDCAL